MPRVYQAQIKQFQEWCSTLYLDRPILEEMATRYMEECEHVPAHRHWLFGDSSIWEVGIQDAKLAMNQSSGSSTQWV